MGLRTSKALRYTAFKGLDYSIFPSPSTSSILHLVLLCWEQVLQHCVRCSHNSSWFALQHEGSGCAKMGHPFLTNTGMTFTLSHLCLDKDTWWKQGRNLHVASSDKMYSFFLLLF